MVLTGVSSHEKFCNPYHHSPAFHIVQFSCNKDHQRFAVYSIRFSTIKKIVLHSFGTERFSGLLGFMKQEGGIYYNLLDATGIKLLEAEVKNNGGYII